MIHSICTKKRQLWKVSGESSIWNNYPTKPRPDKLSRLFIIEPEDIIKYEFVCSSFNKNGNKLATIDQRGNIYEFDFKTFKCQLVSRCGSCGVSITYSPQYDDITVALNNKCINIFECGQYTLTAKIKTNHENEINQLQFSYLNSNKLVLLSCSSDSIIIWDINNNYQQLQSLSHHYSIMFGLIAPSFQSIVTCFGNDIISFWDWTNYKQKYELFYSNKQLLKEKIGHKYLQLICGDIDNKNGLLIAGGAGNYIYLWIINKRILLKCIVLPITIKHVIQLNFLFNNIILALGDDGQIIALNHKTLNISFYIQRNDQFIKSFCISKNNKKISCTLSDGSIEIMSIKSLCKQYKKACRKCSDSEINSLNLQPSKLSSVALSELQKHIQTQTDNNNNNKSNNIIPCKLSVDKLKNYLLTNNCYADKYRLIIWNFLLNLPQLSNVYKDYQQKGNNKKWTEKLKLLNDNNMEIRLKHRLLNILSLLSNWCTLCENIDFLPSFILPFIKLYKQNNIQCFECILFILCKYCSEWFIDFPDLSIKILSFWISVIKHFDNTLYKHFKHHFISIENNLWYIISNAFYTFFNETDWLLLWDHIITNTPLFFHILPVSIVLCCKNTLYSIHSNDDIDAFFGHKQQIYIKNIIDKTYFILQHLPTSLIPTFEAVTIPIDYNENDNEIKHYPIFNRYPVECLALIHSKDIRKLENKKNNQQQEELLKALQTEHLQITEKQTKFAQEQQMLDYLYKQRLSALQLEEEENALKQKAKSDEITQKRLNAIENIQKSIKEMLNQQHSIKQLTINDVENKLIHHRKISEIEHDSFRNSATLNQLESDTRNSLNSMHLQQEIEAQQLKLQRLQQQFDQEEKLKQQLLEQTLLTKNNVSKFKCIKQKNLLSTISELQNKSDLEQLVKNKLKLESIINDNRIKQIETKNECTDAMNQQLTITQNMIEKQNKLQNICKKQEDFEIDIMTNEYNKFVENIKTKKEHILKDHKNELLKKLNKQQMKLNKLSKQQRLKHFKHTLKQQENTIKSDLFLKDQQLEETINLIQKQIQNLHEKEIEIDLRDKEILEKNAFECIAKDAEMQIVNQEKQKYSNIRQEMLKGMQKKEQFLKERHENVMNKLMKEREDELLSIAQNAKNEVYDKEMSELQKEYENKKKELAELKDSFNEKQNQIRHKLFQQSNVVQNILNDE